MTIPQPVTTDIALLSEETWAEYERAKWRVSDEEWYLALIASKKLKTPHEL
jgi:hypothetical protein